MYSTLPVTAKRTSQNRRMYGVITYVREDVALRIKVARDVDWDDEVAKLKAVDERLDELFLLAEKTTS